MNRLHHIGQTAAAYLAFPGSTTSRFGHAVGAMHVGAMHVGAMHVGGRIIDTVLGRLKKHDFDALFPRIKSPEFLTKSVRLACLLHDIGHGPFSHSSEESMLHVMERYHPEEVKEARRLFDVQDVGRIPAHEYYTYKLIRHGEISETILSHEDDGLRDFAADLVVKSEASHTSRDNRQGYRILRKIVSGQLDADRMDYLLRDSMMSGVQFGQIDIYRLIWNMVIVKNRTGVYQLALQERSLGSVEDMLDARYKMYRYFYNHHSVVATNELLLYATDALVRDDRDSTDLFHWTSYDSGHSTDAHVLDLLRERQHRNDFVLAKGLLDRRFMPISIFKSTPDMGRFIDEIRRLSGISLTRETTRNSIASFFDRANGADRIRTELEKKPSLEDCKIFQSEVTLKPYSPFSPDDRVYLSRAPGEDLCELYSESPYFRAINEQWAKFKGMFFFYLVPGQTRSEFKVAKEDVRSILASEIASYVRSE